MSVYGRYIYFFCVYLALHARFASWMQEFNNSYLFISSLNRRRRPCQYTSSHHWTQLTLTARPFVRALFGSGSRMAEMAEMPRYPIPAQPAICFVPHPEYGPALHALHA